MPLPVPEHGSEIFVLHSQPRCYPVYQLVSLFVQTGVYLRASIKKSFAGFSYTYGHRSTLVCTHSRPIACTRRKHGQILWPSRQRPELGYQYNCWMRLSSVRSVCNKWIYNSAVFVFNTKTHHTAGGNSAHPLLAKRRVAVVAVQTQQEMGFLEEWRRANLSGNGATHRVCA